MTAYRVGIIGHPLQHSISPIFQNAALRYCGIDATYEPWETRADSLMSFLTWLRETPDARGINVTVPHKESVFEAVDHVDPVASAVGAVNTVVAHEGKLFGYNTDVPGFLRGLGHDSLFDPRGARVLLLGAGGAAKAVTVGLAQQGIAHLTIANRTLSRAEAVMNLARSQGASAEAIPLKAKMLEDRGAIWDLIVNTTTMGMRHSITEHESPLPLAVISRSTLVYDLVYNPPITPLMEAAMSVGARTLSGLPMLIYQGAESFSLWTGVAAPVEEMMLMARRALQL